MPYVSLKRAEAWDFPVVGCWVSSGVDLVLLKLKLWLFLQVDESQTGEPGWLGGELKGKTGWFPANYAEKIPENEVPAPVKTVTDSTSAPAPKLALRETPAPLAVTSSEPSTTPNNWADFSSTYVLVGSFWWFLKSQFGHFFPPLKYFHSLGLSFYVRGLAHFRYSFLWLPNWRLQSLNWI